MTVHWSTVALERVSDIVDSFPPRNPEAAERWVEDMFATAERLELFPRSGRVVPELEREEIREVFYQRYRIIYKVASDRAKVLTVRHMRQQLRPRDIEE